MRKVSYQPRPHLVQVLRRYLLAGYDVELLSPRGNGGTRFLRELLAELREHGQAVLHLPDVGEERPVPSALLSALSDQGRSVPTPALSSPVELAAYLERAYGSRPLTILVDGPQALPPLLQATIALYRTTAQLQLVLLCERESAVPERSPQAVSVALPTLTLEEVGAVLTSVCGAPLEAETLSRIYAKSGGLVKLAVAMTEVGMIEGYLKPLDGHWCAVRDLWSSRLLPMVRGYVQTEASEDRDALEAIAIAGLTSAAEAAALIGAERLERLEQRNLVSVEPSGSRHWVTVNPPILGEMYRHAKSSVRLARVGAHIEQVTSRRVDGHESVERELRLGKIDPLMLRRVAERRAETLREARRCWEELPSAGSGLAYVEAQIASSVPADEVLAVLAAASEAGPSQQQRAWLRIWEARVLGHQVGDLAGALRVLDSDGGGREELGEYSGLVVAARVRLCADLDVLPQDAEAQLNDWTEAAAPARYEALCELVAVHYARGRLNRAQAVLESIPTEAGAPLCHRLRFYEALITLARGHYDAAMELGAQGFEDAKDELDGSAMRAYTYVLHLLILARGQGVSVARVNEEVTSLGAVPTFPQGAYLGIRVCGIVSANGSSDEVHAMVKELSDVRVTTGPLPGTGRAWAEAKLAATLGEPVRAATLCWEEALELRRRGGDFSAAQSALRSLEYRFDDARAEVAAEWIGGMESEQLAVTLEYLCVRAHGTVQEVRDVISRLAATGQVGHAMQAYRDLGRSSDVRNDHELAADIMADREAFSSELENSGMDLLQMVATEAKLTRREEEVARLIAAGLTNRQIQEELVLSIRTVENHVHRLMRKLRVSTRQEVVEAVRGWVGEGTQERP